MNIKTYIVPVSDYWDVEIPLIHFQQLQSDTRTMNRFLKQVETITWDIREDILLSLNTLTITDPAVHILKFIKRPQFPVVMMDATTHRSLLEPLKEKNIFNDRTKDLPKYNELIAAESGKLGRKLSFTEERSLLTNTSQYIKDHYVIRDYGSYAIGFSTQVYIEKILDLERLLKGKDVEPDLFDQYTEEINKGLEQIHFWKHGYQIAKAILAEVAIQKSLKIEISKERLLQYLDIDKKSGYIYRLLEEVLMSLRTIDYVLYNFGLPKTKKDKFKMTGYFIYNLADSYKSYKISVNEYFVGCVLSYIEGSNNRDDYQRGKMPYPTALIPAGSNMTDKAFYLMEYFTGEKGNPKLNTEEHKVISQKIRVYIDKCKLQNPRLGANYRNFLEALKETSRYYIKIEPDMKVLEKLKPSKAINTILRVYLDRDIQKFDDKLKSKIRER